MISVYKAVVFHSICKIQKSRKTSSMLVRYFQVQKALYQAHACSQGYLILHRVTTTLVYICILCVCTHAYEANINCNFFFNSLTIILCYGYIQLVVFSVAID